MNIFVIDKDPIRSAIQLHDKHVVKMIVESAQMLSTIRRFYGDNNPYLYKSCFINHPCTKWVSESEDNYIWLLTHFKALCDEYGYRYFKIHKCMDLIPHFTNDLNSIPNIGLTPFATAMPSEFKTDDPIESYRNYYIGKKIDNKFWTNRKKEDLDDWLSSKLNGNQFKVNLLTHFSVRS